MITSKAIKGLTALLKRSEAPKIAVVGAKAQVYSMTRKSGLYFVFEVPRDDVLDDVLEKYAGEPINLETTLSHCGYANYSNAADWRAVLTIKDVPHEVAVVVMRDDAPDEDGEPVEYVRLRTESGQERLLNAAFYDFFNDQLLQPAFKIQAGKQWDGSPTSVTVWDGDEFVGMVAGLTDEDAPSEEEEKKELQSAVQRARATRRNT